MAENVLAPPAHADYDTVGRGYRLKRRLQRMADLRLSIGESDGGDADEFKPSFVIRRWGGECAFGLKFIDTGRTGRTVDSVNEKVRWRDDTGFEIRFFDKPNDTEIGEDGSFEFDFLIPSLPPSNRFNFRVRKQNCVMYYQDPAERGVFDPVTNTSTAPDGRVITWRNRLHFEQTVGSYAIYHSSKMHGPYQTGKIGHLFTPIAIDANGDRRSCAFNADAETTGVLQITIPNAWLQAAAFPVRIDPSVGYTTIGGSASGVIDNRQYVQWAFQVTTGAASITGAQIYSRITSASGTNQCMVSCYSKGATVALSLLLAGSSTVDVNSTTAQWWSATMSGTLLTATDYIAGAMYADTASKLQLYYDTVTSGDVKTLTEATFAFPATLTGYGNSTLRVSAYFDYTASGGSIVPILDAHRRRRGA